MMMAMLIPLAEIPVGCPFHLITAEVPDRFRKCGAFGMDSHRFDFNHRDLIVVTNSLRVRVHRFLLTRHVKSYGPACPFLAWHMFFFSLTWKLPYPKDTSPLVGSGGGFFIIFWSFADSEVCTSAISLDSLTSSTLRTQISFLMIGREWIQQFES